MTRGIRVGVIGAGGAAQVLHLPILSRLTDVQVVGIVDPNDLKAETIAERFHVPHTAASITELAERTEVDAVVVCTPNRTHETLVLEALAAGTHVLCELPLAVNAESAARMVEAARSADLLLMAAMNGRYRYDTRAIRQFVASGELGEVFFVRSSWLNQHRRRPRRGWRREADVSGGGVLMDLGAPAIDLPLWLLGFPAVERVFSRFHGGTDVEDTAIVSLALAGGGTVAVEVTWELMESRDVRSLAVFGTAGTARTDPLRVRRELATGLSDVTPPFDRSPTELYADSYRQEWAEFTRVLRGEKPRVVANDQIQLLRVIEACYRSAEEGREVPV